jgi:hypothetical protein
MGFQDPATRWDVYFPNLGDLFQILPALDVLQPSLLDFFPPLRVFPLLIEIVQAVLHMDAII